jgi:hypothetical protein
MSILKRIMRITTVAALGIHILHASAVIAADATPTSPAEPVQPRDTRPSAPADNASDYDPNTGQFKSDTGPKQDTDSTRNPSANPYDRSIQPTDIPPKRPSEPLK